MVIHSTPSPTNPDRMKRKGAVMPEESMAIRISTVESTNPVLRARPPKSLVKRYEISRMVMSATIRNVKKSEKKIPE